MPAIITLECQGKRLPLASWNITEAHLRLVSMGTDTLTITTKSGDMWADPLFPFDAAVNLYSGSTRIFKGTVTTLPAQGSGAGESVQYVISGPWYLLTQIFFQQPRKTYPDGVATTTDSSRVMLSMNGDVTSPIDNGQQIRNFLAFGRVRYDMPIANGTITLNTQPPIREMRDITLADGMLEVLRWTPGAATWFDYSVEPPTFNAQKRTELSSQTFDVEGGTMADISISRRDDLVPPGVIFYFEQVIIVDGVQRVWIDNRVAGSFHEIGTLIHTFQLQGSTTSTPEPPPVGLATNYYSNVSIVHYEGTLVIRESELSFLLRPGVRFQLSNARTEHETMNALIQQADFDLVNGVSSIDFGPPNQLGPQDYFALAAQAKGTSPISDMATSGGTGTPPAPPDPPQPFPPTPGDPPDKKPFPTIEIEGCDGTKICVVGSSGGCGTPAP